MEGKKETSGFILEQGFDWRPGKSHQGHWREFVKGDELLVHEDVGVASKWQFERISVGVVYHGWEALMDVRFLRPELKEYVSNQQMGFDKSWLKEGGYRKVMEAIGELEKAGYFEVQLTRLKERYQFARQIFDAAADKLRAVIPSRYDGFVDRFDGERAIYFFMNQGSGKNNRVIKVGYHAGGIEVERGFARVEDGTLITNSFGYRTRTETLYWPAAKYQTGKIEDAVAEVDAAAEALTEFYRGK